MSEQNSIMAAMLTSGIAEYDPMFDIAVLERIERRRFVRSLWITLAVALTASLVLAITAPQLNLIQIFAARWYRDLWAPLAKLLSDYRLAAMLLLAELAVYHSRQSNRGYRSRGGVKR